MKSEMMRNVCVTMVVLMTVGRTSTLTTFGTQKNTDTEKNKTPAPPSVPGRPCKNDTDCSLIKHTTCMRKDGRDKLGRCLCVNHAVPLNGACPKPVGTSCKEDKECLDGAHCTTQINSTSTAKTCLCKDGFFEEDRMCSAGFFTNAPSTMPLLVAFSILWLASRPDSTF